MSSDYLKVQLFETSLLDASEFEKIRIRPFANSEIFYSYIENAERLTGGQDVKTVYKIVLNSKDIKHEFLPGDTIGICASNNECLVEEILERLNVKNDADRLCEISILSGTTKKNATIPKHLPEKSTLRNIFLNYVNIQTSPKKVLLKSLARHTENPDERKRLETCASPKTTPEYSQLLTSTKNLLHLLNTFPSCRPPVEILLEHLPPILPRPYSISSSPLSHKLEITFFVLERNDGSTGLCTGWLQDLIFQKNKRLVPFYFRQPTAFSLPQDPTVPLVLVATGTGITPFRGFLQHRLLQEATSSSVWLFYGCRYQNRDCLYQNELEDYLKRGVISKLDLAFSRDAVEKKYVQHKMVEHGEEVKEWIISKQARVFVCGDLKTVVKGVKEALVAILPDAEEFVQKMEDNGQFVIDNWL